MGEHLLEGEAYLILNLFRGQFLKGGAWKFERGLLIQINAILQNKDFVRFL